MNNEKYNQIIDEAYNDYSSLFNSADNYFENYLKKYEQDKTPGIVYYVLDPLKYRPYTQEEFINKCKTDSEFSERWGLKIEERELSAKERIVLAIGKIQEKYPALIEESLRICDEREIPTKLITLTCNNETIENYE